ncbi:GNAT family N-acetyltransferase [Paenibacillus peoriae]|uniref:GNAT family N-acetyltransferase n=1 Tax=Paenibacillus peoriae TaxID=59893 RepID=UPI00026C6122|nr:GNAT family N-acetyltransferase [Paenibacillus peoriae]MEC0184754.1 GNAT family N-acetyltransferase [Paenibacillus peoriae]
MEFLLAKADYEHVQSIYETMCRIDEEIHDRNYFVADDLEYVKQHIREDGFTMLAWDQTNLAGFLIVDTAGEKEGHLGHDLQWPVERIQTSAVMNSVCILPCYRGFGLQKTLLKQGEQTLISMGFSSFLATVYPSNSYSLNNFLNLGYIIGDTKLKYGGVLRHILYKTYDSKNWMK